MSDAAAIAEPADVPAFLREGGAAGAIMRAHDWTGHPFGPPELWPPALRSAAALCLTASIPTAFYWGEDQRLIFGDAWAPFLDGRGAWAIGRPAREVWRDVWDVVRPHFEQVAAGHSVRVEDVRIDIEQDGHRSERYWTYGISPIVGDDGVVQGAFNVTTEVTEQVIARRLQRAMIELGDRFAELSDADSIVREGCAVIGRTLGVARAGRGFVDQAERSVEVTASWSDGAPNADGIHLVGELWPGFIDELRAGVPVVVHDVSSDPRTIGRRDSFLAQHVGAFINVAVAEHGHVRLITFVHADRPRRWSALEVSFVRDVVSRGRAAADRARAQAALRESEIRHRHAVELSPLHMWTAQPDGRLDHVAPGLAESLGRAADATGADWVEVVHPDDRPGSIAAWTHAVATATPYDAEHRVAVADGSYRWMRSRANPQRDATGVVVKWYGSNEDIDDAKRADAALAASEARLRAITDSVDQMIWSTRPDGFHDYYNQTWRDFTGILPEADDGDGWHGHPDDEERAWGAWRQSLRTGEPYHMEYRLRHRTGQFRWVLARAQSVRDSTGAIERWYGTCTDIEEIVAARDVLARSRNELEQLVLTVAADRERIWRLSTELMLVLRLDGTITAANPAWTRLLGWPEHELVGSSVLDLIHPDDLAATRRELAKQSTGEATDRFVNRYRGRNGVVHWLSWTAATEAGLIHAVARDITAERQAAAELHAAQEVLRQTQKMEAVGQLTGGIAHDFNNMLAVVVGSLDLLARRLGSEDERSRRYVTNAMEGARRAAALTQRLLAFARQQKLSPVLLDVGALIGGMGELLQGSLGAFVQLEASPAPGLWPTLADQNQLENAILNLAVNARDAMPQGGKLCIAASNVSVGQQHPGVPPGDYVVLTIADTGVGMSAEIIERVFDPFFTTKDVGRGTGLGLSQVYGFVRQSGGQVTIASKPGEGTTVTLFLPRSHDQPTGTVPTEPTRPTPARAKGETVLVVEDEPSVRRFSVEAVDALGYRVLEAAGAQAALAFIDSDNPIDLLFTDIVMPDMNGRALADEARRRRPGIRVLFATGYARGEDGGGLHQELRLIGKPFTVEQLSISLDEALNHPGRSVVTTDSKPASPSSVGWPAEQRSEP